MEMTMKIPSLEIKPPTLVGAKERKPPMPPTPVPGAAQASTKVELSAAALSASGGMGASFDAQKVSRITQAIRDGSFKPNAEAIADKLIANATRLLAKAYR